MQSHPARSRDSEQTILSNSVHSASKVHDFSKAWHGRKHDVEMNNWADHASDHFDLLRDLSVRSVLALLRSLRREPDANRVS